MGDYYVSLTDGDYYVSPSLMGELFYLTFNDGGLLFLSFTDETIMSPLQ
jgi:hypothetical protein